MRRSFHLALASSTLLGVLLSATIAGGYPVSTVFTIDPGQSSLSVKATESTFGLNDTDVQSLNGTINATFEFGASGALPDTADVTVTGASLATGGDYLLVLGVPPILGVRIVAADLAASLTTPEPPAELTKLANPAGAYQFDAAEFELTINQGTITATGLVSDSSNLAESPVSGSSPAGTFGTITFVPGAGVGPYTLVAATLDFPIDVTEIYDPEGDGPTVTMELTGALRASASFYVALGGVPGDFTGDGAVDGADLPVWKSAFGTSGATADDGDANNDGDTDGADFLVWQRNYGLAPPAGAAATIGAVPEPATAALGLFSLAALGHGVRRGRRGC